MLSSALVQSNPAKTIVSVVDHKDSDNAEGWLALYVDPKDPVNDKLKEASRTLQVEADRLHIPFKPTSTPHITLLYGYTPNESAQVMATLKDKMKTPLFFRANTIMVGDVSPVILLRLESEPELEKLHATLKKHTQVAEQKHRLFDHKYQAYIVLGTLDETLITDKDQKDTKEKLNITRRSYLQQLNLNHTLDTLSKSITGEQIKFTKARSLIESKDGVKVLGEQAVIDFNDSDNAEGWLELDVDSEDPFNDKLEEAYRTLKVEADKLHIPLVKPTGTPHITLLYGYTPSESGKVMTALKDKMKTPFFFRANTVMVGDISPVILLRLEATPELEKLHTTLKKRTQVATKKHRLFDNKYQAYIVLATLDQPLHTDNIQKDAKEKTNITKLSTLQKLNSNHMLEKLSEAICGEQIKFTKAHSLIENNDGIKILSEKTVRNYKINLDQIPENHFNNFYKLYSKDRLTFIFGGLSKIITRKMTLEEQGKFEESKALSLKSSDLDILTHASGQESGPAFPEWRLVISSKVSDLFWLTNIKTGETIDIRKITDPKSLMLGKDVGHYVACTMDGLLITLIKRSNGVIEPALIDVTGRGIKDIYTNKIHDLPQGSRDTYQLWELSSHIKNNFKLSKTTLKYMLEGFPKLNLPENCNVANDGMLKVFLANKPEIVLDRLLSPLSENVSTLIVDLLFPECISRAIKALCKKTYNNSVYRNGLLEIIALEQQLYAQHNASIVPIYEYFLKLVMEYENITDTTPKRIRRNEIIHNNPLFNDVLKKEPGINLLLEHSLFKAYCLQMRKKAHIAVADSKDSKPISTKFQMTS